MFNKPAFENIFFFDFKILTFYILSYYHDTNKTKGLEIGDHELSLALQIRTSQSFPLN